MFTSEIEKNLIKKKKNELKENLILSQYLKSTLLDSIRLISYL